MLKSGLNNRVRFTVYELADRIWLCKDALEKGLRAPQAIKERMRHQLGSEGSREGYRGTVQVHLNHVSTRFPLRARVAQGFLDAMLGKSIVRDRLKVRLMFKEPSLSREPGFENGRQRPPLGLLRDVN